MGFRSVATLVVNIKKGMVWRVLNYPRLRTSREIPSVGRRQESQMQWLVGRSGWYGVGLTLYKSKETNRCQRWCDTSRALGQCETTQLAVNADDLVYSSAGEPETFRASSSLSEKPLCIPLLSYPSPNQSLGEFPLHSSRMRTPSLTPFQ